MTRRLPPSWSRRSAAFVILFVIAAGCVTHTEQRGSSPTQPAGRATTSSPALATSTSTSEAATTVAPSSYRSTVIPFTTKDGISYLFTPRIGRVSVTLAKDISRSPPGKARLKVSGLSSTAGSSFPGILRATSAPTTLAWQTTVSVQWPLPAATAAKLLPSGTDQVAGMQSCIVYQAPSLPPDPAKQVPVFQCTLEAGKGTGADEETDDLSQADVDAMVAASSHFGQPYVSARTSDPARDGTTFLLLPDGRFSVDGGPISG